MSLVKVRCYADSSIYGEIILNNEKKYFLNRVLSTTKEGIHIIIISWNVVSSSFLYVAHHPVRSLT